MYLNGSVWHAHGVYQFNFRSKMADSTDWLIG